jgi:sensor domain CHASE-containing protein
VLSIARVLPIACLSIQWAADGYPANPKPQTYTVSPPVSRSLPDIRNTPAPQQLGALILVSALALAALAIAVAVLAKILVGSFEQIEIAEMHQKGVQVFRALDTDLRQLHLSNRDYAEFDDSVAFLETHNPAFISANFTRETLAGLHVDIVWIVDSHGNEVYSGYFDRNRN